jgi:hypothetical protein
VARAPRDIVPGRLYLVSQQGNKHQPVYLDEEDRAVATRLLHLCALRYCVRIHAYCFGEYEARWLLEPSDRHGLSYMMRDMLGSYSRYLNQKYNHRPCCAQRQRTGREPCHPDGEPIDRSSNWRARFQSRRVPEQHYHGGVKHVHHLAQEQPSPSDDLSPHVAGYTTPDEQESDDGRDLSTNSIANCTAAVLPSHSQDCASQKASRQHSPAGQGGRFTAPHQPTAMNASPWPGFSRRKSKSSGRHCHQTRRHARFLTPPANGPPQCGSKACIPTKSRGRNTKVAPAGRHIDSNICDVVDHKGPPRTGTDDDRRATCRHPVTRRSPGASARAASAEKTGRRYRPWQGLTSPPASLYI